ncbi:MAG: hypothetical protein QNJ81_08665 [Acidimicrobiia bacterium]|nr:hypothetical protein [Acidimicrobiia bacterium]
MTEIEYGTWEFALWLLLAVAVGFAVGWMLRKWWLDRNEAGRIEEIRSEAAAKEATLEAELDEHRTKTQALSRDMDLRSADVDRLEAQLAEREETISALEATADAARNNVSRLEAEVEERESTIATLRAAAEKEDPRIASPHGELEAEHAERGAVLAEEADTAADWPDRDTAVAKVAEIAARTRGAGPAVDDDLKKIRGVGPKLEVLLKSMDITSFEQVANFTADDILYVTAALDAFPGRIERDNWMASAAAEHAKKYGDPA